MQSKVDKYESELELRIAERYVELLSRNAPVDTGALSSSFEVERAGDGYNVVGLGYGKYVDRKYIEDSIEEVELDISNGFY